MLMSYLGAFKAWIYMPVFHVFGPTPWSLRLPMLLAGAATIYILAMLLRRVHGNLAAGFGAVLLATDATFLLTVCCDWGPVALQILLTTAALLLFVRRNVFWAFFCLGLALWNKALMLWILAGLAVASLALFRRELKPRLLPAAALGFCLGSLPFLLYNVRTGFQTFRENSSFTFSEIRGKYHLLQLTLSGAGLFGYLVEEDHATPAPAGPATALDRVTFGVADTLGNRREGWLGYAFAASVLLLPVLWRTAARTPVLFSAIVFAAAWLQMAITRNAGGSVHHAVLLWPLPHLAVAVAAAEIGRRRRWIAVGIAAVAFSNVLVITQYYVQVRRNGGANNWNESNQVLAARLQQMRPPRVFVVDWGFFDTLRMMSRGSLPLRWAADMGDDAVVKAWLASPGAVFVSHSEGNESFVGRRAQLLGAAERLGFDRDTILEIHDRNGRPRFELYRFSPVPAAEALKKRPVRVPVVPSMSGASR